MLRVRVRAQDGGDGLHGGGEVAGPGLRPPGARARARTHTHTHTHTQTRTHARTHACTHARLHARTHIHQACIRTHARTHTPPRAHSHKHKHTYSDARTHARTHARTLNICYALPVWLRISRPCLRAACSRRLAVLASAQSPSLQVAHRVCSAPAGPQRPARARPGEGARLLARVGW